MTVGFWVYANRVHRYAKVHRAECTYCNHGKGIQPRRRDVAGGWLGPFTTPAEAHAAATGTGQRPSPCGACAPAEPDADAAGGEPPPQPDPPRSPARPPRAPGDDHELAELTAADLASTLVVIGCSSSKHRRGEPSPVGSSILAELPDELGEELASARRRNAERARIDEQSGWLPAVRRYTGFFYTAAQGALQPAGGQPSPLVILSGGYGLVRADEHIRYYDAWYRPGWWPHRVVERALAAYAEQLGVRGMVAFLPATSAYAEVVKRTDWAGIGLDFALLLTPDSQGRGGAQQAVPTASGEAYAAFQRHELGPGWRSQGGLGLRPIRLA